MAFVQREMTGVLFVNDRKEKDTHPDHKGTCLIDGVTYEIGAWDKGGRLSLSFKVKSAGYRTELLSDVQIAARRPMPLISMIPPPPEAIDDLPF